jgi:antitoxin component of RelBE/YafQ-DinJ toxin-antitoxin module
MTDAINMFLAQVTLRSGLPFDVTVPETDREFYNSKEAAFRNRVKLLNEAIEAGEEGIRQGRYVNGNDFKTQLRQHVQTVKARKKPS